MNYKTFDNFKDAASFASKIAKDSKYSAKLTRINDNWQVEHPRLENNNNKDKSNTIDTAKVTDNDRIKLVSKDNSFKFAIRKTSSTKSVYGDNPEAEKNKLLMLVKDYFPESNVKSKIKTPDEVGIKISDTPNEYFILIEIIDESMPAEDFNELLNDLAKEFDYMHLSY